MTALTRCLAYRVSDQMTCPTCGLTWDINDTKPVCKPKKSALKPFYNHPRNNSFWVAGNRRGNLRG